MHQFAETEDNRSGYIVPCLGFNSELQEKEIITKHSMRTKTKIQITLTIVTKMMVSKLNM